MVLLTYSGSELRPVLDTDPDATDEQTYLKYDREHKFTLLKTAKAVEGSPIMLEGKVTGHPMPTIRWLKNEQEFVPDGDRVKSFLNPDGTFGLIFEKSCGLGYE